MNIRKGELREGRKHEVANGVVGVTTWLFFGISIITVFIFLLGSIDSDFEFRSTATFMFIFIATFMMINLFLLLSSNLDHIKDDENGLLFFMNDIDLVRLGWVPASFLGVLLTSIALAEWDYTYAPHVSIFISGIILFIGFERTGSILVPILGHGFYNSLVVFLNFNQDKLQFLQGLASSPIIVPEIGISVANVNRLFTEMIFQIVLVAAAEEMFKIFIIIFTIVAIRSKFDTDIHGLIIVGGLVSIFVWMVYHTILAIPS